MLSLNRLLFCLILIGNSLGAFSQGKGDGISLHDKNRNTNPHAFYLELGGSSVIYSANYERLLVKSNKTALFARVGLQYIPLKRAQSVIHFYLTTPPTRIFLTPVLGIRYFSKRNDYGEYFMMRLSFTPLFGMNVFANPADNSSSLPAILPFAGISFGKTWGGRK
jgi:hypothetical protein